MDPVLWILVCGILFWIGAIFHVQRKGMNQIIEGIISIDQRLAEIDKNLRRQG
jgi:hypothetical protein